MLGLRLHWLPWWLMRPLSRRMWSVVVVGVRGGAETSVGDVAPSINGS